jgi:hypothetical protein
MLIICLEYEIHMNALYLAVRQVKLGIWYIVPAGCLVLEVCEMQRNLNHIIFIVNLAAKH